MELACEGRRAAQAQEARGGVRSSARGSGQPAAGSRLLEQRRIETAQDQRSLATGVLDRERRAPRLEPDHWGIEQIVVSMRKFDATVWRSAWKTSRL